MSAENFSKGLDFLAVARRYLDLDRVLAIRERMIGTGAVQTVRNRFETKTRDWAILARRLAYSRRAHDTEEDT